jgi:threonine aldolase
MRYHFASDNTAGITPEAWTALAEANAGYAPGYGEDAWTQRAADLIRKTFETDCEVFFTFNGTAANSLALSAMCRSYHGIICHELAHVATDECGAPEFYSNGSKVLTVKGARCKVDPGEIDRIVRNRRNIHFPKPKVLSITQATEAGTLYSPAEIAILARTARQHGLLVHMDGARFANAVASLELSPAELSWKNGVDVLSLGGTKQGMPVGDAVVFFNRELAYEFEYRCKQAGQLASKMRFLAAPWIGMLEDGAWLRHARHANACARRLAAGLRQLPGIEFLAPVEANGVFVKLPEQLNAYLHDKGWRYYAFLGGSRLMCNWSTTEADIDALFEDVRQGLKKV